MTLEADDRDRGDGAEPRRAHSRRGSASSASTASCATASACSTIRPGSHLSEEELAQEFEISRTPVRRVLARLESEGLVQSVHGVGTIVTDVDIEELQQVYHLRLELALLIGKTFADPAHGCRSRSHSSLIERCDADLRNPDQRAFLRLNMDFFYELNAMTGNQPLREISERLYIPGRARRAEDDAATRPRRGVHRLPPRDGGSTCRGGNRRLGVDRAYQASAYLHELPPHDASRGPR